MNTTTTSRSTYVLTTLIAAVTAACAAAVSLSLALPVWAMFIGWIAFYTRGLNTRSAFENLACVGIGLVTGALAASAIPLVASVTGPSSALPLVVLVVALFVVSLRGLPIMSNLLGYFLGLVTWFAAHLEPTLPHLLTLFFATAIGSLGGWIAVRLPAYVAKPA
jgi:hypothetical protein